MARGSLPDGWDPRKKSIVIFGTPVAMDHIHSKNILHKDLPEQES